MSRALYVRLICSYLTAAVSKRGSPLVVLFRNLLLHSHLSTFARTDF